MATPDERILSESADGDLSESPSVSLKEDSEYDASCVDPLPGSSLF